MTAGTHREADLQRQPPPAAVDCAIDDEGVAVLRLGGAGESMVTLTQARLAALEQALASLQQDGRLSGVIVTGPGPGMFCAGADVNLIAQITTAADGAAAATQGREIFRRLQALPVPVVAAIDGPCLGGGFELALFCDCRVASDAGNTLLGLPEVKLGIVPGFGGTQNLTRLVGLPRALDLILQGRTLPAKAALRAGLVDRVAPAERLLQAARDELRQLRRRGRKAPARRLRGGARWLSLPPLRALVAHRVRRQLERGPARFYPAPRAALQLCLLALGQDRELGFRREAEALGELIVTPVSKGLCNLFFLSERSKRLGKQDGAVAVERAVVVGGGVMGAGIAGLLAEHGVQVRLCDLAPPALLRAKARLQGQLDRKLRQKRLLPPAARAAQDRLAVAAAPGSLRQVGLFLEAVVEDPAVKQQLLQRAVEQGLPATALIASNTSSLSIDAMAAAVPAPERVVGIHFFNPPEKMPLVEVVKGARTGEAAVATACRLAVRLGKLPVVVRDAPGFLVNRCLSPYLNEAARLLEAGNEPEFVDRVLLDFGMPMGPCRLLDEIGFDVAAKVSEVMRAAFGPRMQPSPLFAAMVEASLLGQKSGGGLYGAGGRGAGPGRKVLLRLRARRSGGAQRASRSEVLQRLIYPMVDEAYRCLDEGIVGEPADLDLGLCMGIGFPPFTGGITRYAQREGLAGIVTALDELARRLDPGFAASDGLRRRAVEQVDRTGS